MERSVHANPKRLKHPTAIEPSPNKVPTPEGTRDRPSQPSNFSTYALIPKVRAALSQGGGLRVEG